MSTTVKAAVHLGPNCTDILDVYRNAHFEELKNRICSISRRVILDHQAGILNVSPIDWTGLFMDETYTDT